MNRLLQIVTMLVLLSVSIYGEENDTRKLCDNEVKKDRPNLAVLKTQCLKTAKFYEDEQNYENASWYYLLAGENDYNTKIIQKQKINNTSNIAHSYILNGKMDESKALYVHFLKNMQIQNVDKAVQDDYKLLLKLYPNKKETLLKGLYLWNDIYKPFLAIPELNLKYKKAISEQKYQKAINYLMQIIKLQEEYFKGKINISIIHSWIDLASLYKDIGNYDKALINYTKLVNVDTGIFSNKALFQGTIYNDISLLYELMGNYDEALTYYKKALVIYEKILGSEHQFTANIYNNISLLYDTLGNYQKALYYNKKALVIFEKVLGKKHLKTAASYNNIGTLYQTIGNYQKSLSYYKKSLVIREKVLGKEHLKTAISYNNIGGFYMSLGDYLQALYYYKKVLLIKEKVLGKEHIGTATSYNNIGVLYKTIGNYMKASKYYKKALIINEKVLGKGHISTAINYDNIAEIFILLKDYQKALLYYKKALKIREKKLGIKHPDIAASYSHIGLLYHYENKYNNALVYTKKALQIREDVLGNKHPKIISSYYNIASLYHSMKEYKKAYINAKKSYDTFIINRDKNFAILSNKQKKLYLKSNSNKIPLLLSTAYLYGKKDLTYIDDSNIPDWLKGSFDKDTNTTKSKKEKDNKKLLLHQTILTDWLNYKGSIYDSENSMITLYENTKDKDIKEKIDQLMQTKRQLAKLYQTLPKTKQERKTYQQRIKGTIKSITDIETYIASKASSFEEELGLKDINYKDISKNLKEDELYIDYVKAGGYYYIFTLDNKDNITFNQIDKKDTKTIDKNIKAFRADIDTILNATTLSNEDLTKLKASSQEKLSILYKLTFFKPLKDTLAKYSNLIVSTDGALRLLPFETMFNTTTNRYLIQEKNIRYIPSGKELVRLYRQTATDTKEKIVLFNNPNFDAKDITTLSKADTLDTPSTIQSRAGIIKSLFKMRFISLPGTKEEVKNIKQMLNTKHIQEYAQSEANEENLLKIDTPKILHIATHGFFINDDNIPNPMLKSGIALSGANASAILGKSDGIVTSLKLSGLNLKGTELVVLSACQTGVVDINSTENVSGLNKAFIQAGAKNIVISLWSVADKETSDLMSGFYKEMQTTPDYAQALRNSKLKMIKQDLHPFYWAAFVISGVNND